MDDSTRFKLTLTEGQALAVIDALDLYMRLGIGQIEQMAELLRFGTLPQFRPTTHQGERHVADYATTEQVEERLHEIKSMLGYPRNGSHGIGHPDNHISVTRSYEVLKVLHKVVTDARAPSPGMPTCCHDGLLVRYTEDLKPKAEMLVELPTAEAER